LIASKEWYAYTVNEQVDRIEHVHSGKTFYGVEVSEWLDPADIPLAEVIDAVDQFCRDHPDAGYHEIERKVMELTKAPRVSVRKAMAKRSLRRKVGRPRRH
jgi:hypothetical protein